MGINKETMNKVAEGQRHECIFIETGTHIGDTVALALDAGFKEVRSIELEPRHYQICVDRFRENGDVKLFMGSSEELLKVITSDVEDRMVFWLDAHCSGGTTAGSFDTCPIIDELNIIKSHPRKDHIILIDDMGHFVDGTQKSHGNLVTESQLIDILKSINEDYKIEWLSDVILMAYTD